MYSCEAQIEKNIAAPNCNAKQNNAKLVAKFVSLHAYIVMKRSM